MQSLAYACVGMQYQHHIHDIGRGMWPRCSKVEVRQQALHCELALDRQYDLADAYRKTPHIQFLNCNSTEDLRLFTQAWGPLYLVHTPGADEARLGKAVRRLDECHAHRRWLRAVKGMLDACRGVGDQRTALVEYLAAEVDLERTDSTCDIGKEPFIHVALRRMFGYTGDSLEWADATDARSVGKALALLVEVQVTAPGGGLIVEPRPRGYRVKPSFSLRTLWDALRWMLWFDEWNLSPSLCCPECHRIFQPETAHKTRKYCKYGCAHRATNREWRRKDLRKQKVARKQKGDTNVPRKTR